MVVDVEQRTRRLGRALLPLGLLFAAVGIAMAVIMPFLSLFLSTEVHAGPVQVTVFLMAAPLAGVVAATLVGGVSDRRPIRRKLLVGASLAGLVGTASTSVVRDYWILLGLTVTATAVAGTLFPQAFAYARQVLAGEGSSRAALGTSGLRTVFSAAWVAGPPLAAFLLRVGGFTLVYGMAAAMYAIAALVGIFLLHELEAPIPRGTPARGTPARGTPARGTPARGAPARGTAPATPRAAEPARWVLLVTAFAFTLLHCPMTLGVQALPLFVRADLGGDVSDAGMILGLCAALEIPLMLGLGALTARIPLRVLVLAGAGCGAVYYLSATTASGVWVLVAAQLANAAFIAAVSGLGISYMQELLPLQPGRATTLFTNAFPIGAMLSGPLFGLAQHFGYRLAYGLSAVLCASGLLVLLATRPRRTCAAGAEPGGGDPRPTGTPGGTGQARPAASAHG